MPPIPLPVPSDAPTITPDVVGEAVGVGQLLFWKLTVSKGKGWFGFMGQNLTFKVRADNPCNLGIYGPNPTILGIDSATGKTSGRMRSPKINLPDAKIHQCQGNFTPGTYYLVVRSGDNDPPTGKVEVLITAGSWSVFG